jgi:hypothetical protein
MKRTTFSRGSNITGKSSKQKICGKKRAGVSRSTRQEGKKFTPGCKFRVSPSHGRTLVIDRTLV